MARFNSPLDNVRVSAPCPSDWNQMIGDERVRFCNECSLNVYNLSGMTRREAESLISKTEGRLCVRYYRRRDGTILTKNCPVGLGAIKRRVSRVASAILSTVLGALAGLGIYAGATYDASDSPPMDYRTMGTLTAPEEDSVKIPTQGNIQMGTYPETVGEAKIPDGDYVMGRRIPKKARR